MNRRELTPIQEMQARFSRPGRVDRILMRPERGIVAVDTKTADLLASGIVGDRARAGKRAVTLIQAEHLPVIAAIAGHDSVDAARLRRNLVISGLNILAFRGKRLKIGSAVIELTVPCHPCSQMERQLGHGGYTAMRGHGGMCASVLVNGAIEIGALVEPLAE